MQQHKKGLFYIQDKRQVVGNCVKWYGKDGGGYCVDITKAHVFDAAKERLPSDDDPAKFRAWSKELVDKHIVQHVDIQPLMRETKEFL